MRKRLWCGLILVLLGTASGWTQEFLDDQFQLLDPGLALSFYQADEGSPCQQNAARNEDVAWSSFLCSNSANIHSLVFRTVATGGATDALGRFYQIDLRPFGPATDLGPGLAYEIEIRTDTLSQVVARVPWVTMTDGSDYQVTQLLGLALDNVNGNLYLSVQSRRTLNQRQQEERAAGILKLSGLPTIHDVIREGRPPGPPGPPGPQGPPGPPCRDADMFLMLSLQQQVIAQQGQLTVQQAQISLLRNQLNQALNIRGIKRHLGRPTQEPQPGKQINR